MSVPPLPPEFFSDESEFAAIDRADDYLSSSVFKDNHYGDKEEEETLQTLAAPLADLWILGWLDYEVTQGGLATYFINRHGKQAARAADALRRCGAEEVAQCLDEARSIVVRHEAAWAARNKELDAKGEYAIIRPFQDLEGVDDLQPVAERFSSLWFDTEPHWRQLMNTRLERFRQETAAGGGTAS